MAHSGTSSDIATDPVPEQDIADSLSWQHVLFPDGHLASRASSFGSLKSLVESSSEEEEADHEHQEFSETSKCEEQGAARNHGVRDSCMVSCSRAGYMHDCQDGLVQGPLKKYISLPRNFKFEKRRPRYAIKVEGEQGMLLRALEHAMVKRQGLDLNDVGVNA
ncbi:hypothetical protein GUITHDRAFT_131602 [Guillardia theta CCMP2712]|uniref:Uncharacterized protein n=1 Tax=Guillardia theta (strain CCMP2712) TaxID=905079 RepID=L1K4W3_GUITC|nr:hypothetical protein GUITHDRAFT_131602 [Guillardia theta CCMP2712]EKX55388.1 hypothetical protein GUITHDRAFT_131602 [Guillardia theta CCMP2712]|eukprot:XP_005842368.1 hypothetical protein GUITHDRAFT_131602 [Guillardia theta CCMP2712]